MLIRDQIKQLKKRNLRFKNLRKDINFLIENNYYNVINSNKSLFLENSSSEKYKDGSYFEDLKKIYIFDKDLRNLFLKNIFIIEDKIKTVFAYHLANNNYEDIYLNPNCYLGNQNPSHFIRSEVDKNLRNSDPMILHFLNQNNSNHFVPIWALVNILSIGTLANIYKSLKLPIKTKISLSLGLKVNELENFIDILVFYRNKCAHCYKFFSTKVHFGHGQIVDTKFHSILNIKKKNNIYVNKDSLFSLILIFKFLLDKKQYNEFHISFCRLLLKLKIYFIIRKKPLIYSYIVKIIGIPLKDNKTKQKSWKNLRKLD